MVTKREKIDYRPGFKWIKRLESPLYIFSIFLSITLLTAGLFFYRSQERSARRTVRDQLTSMAELKAREINN